MAKKPDYNFQKRQKEAVRNRKKAEKQQRKRLNKAHSEQEDVDTDKSASPAAQDSPAGGSGGGTD